MQFNINQLKNLHFFLTTGKWSLNVFEATELSVLTSHVDKLINQEKVAEPTPEEDNGKE